MHSGEEFFRVTPDRYDIEKNRYYVLLQVTVAPVFLIRYILYANAQQTFYTIFVYLVYAAGIKQLLSVNFSLS